MNNWKNLRQLTYDQFVNLPETTKLVLLHPNHYGQNRLILAWVLAETKHPSVYLHIADPTALWAELSFAISTQFGRATALQGDSTQDAKRLAPWPGLHIILDGYDLVTDNTTHVAVVQLARQLAPHQRIFVLSRQLPIGLLEHGQTLASGLAMLPVSVRHLLVDYSKPPAEHSTLEVHALGPSQAFINGRLLEHWDGILPKCLFYFMIDRAMTTRDEIFRVFWPDLGKRDATNVFHVTKRKVTEILGESLSMYGGGYYRMSDRIELHYDVITFMETVQQALITQDHDTARALYEEALQLYRGPFLSSLSQNWVNQRRGELEYTYVDALVGLGTSYFENGASDRAFYLLWRAHNYMPHRDDTTHALMRYHLQQGQYDNGLAAYRMLVNSDHPDKEFVSIATRSLAAELEVARDNQH
ncbi:MAG: BTAD domain-containing putative transcriptional regulator [Anaerolineales bacterium]